MTAVAHAILSPYGLHRHLYMHGCGCTSVLDDPQSVQPSNATTMTRTRITRTRTTPPPPPPPPPTPTTTPTAKQSKLRRMPAPLPFPLGRSLNRYDEKLLWSGDSGKRHCRLLAVGLRVNIPICQTPSWYKQKSLQQKNKTFPCHGIVSQYRRNSKLNHVSLAGWRKVVKHISCHLPTTWRTQLD